MSKTAEKNKLIPLFVKLPPEQIVFLRAVVESYELLAEVRTLNNLTGEMVLLAVEDTVEELRQVIKDLSREIPLREVPRPESLMMQDWLLREELDN